MLALARRQHPRLGFARARVEALPFADGSFDRLAGRYADGAGPDLPVAVRVAAATRA